MVGDYGNARIIVQNTSNDFKTGVIQGEDGFISDTELSTLNATEGIYIMAVLAWSTRIFFVEVITTDNKNLSDLMSR